MRRTPERNRRGWILAGLVLLACSLSAIPAISEEAGDDGPLSTPAKAYDVLKAAVDAEDIEAYKKLMSTELAKRMTYEFYIIEGLRSGREYFEKIPKSEATIDEAEAAISKTYDEEKVIATYSLLFLKEDGRWMFNGYKTSTKTK